MPDKTEILWQSGDYVCRLRTNTLWGSRWWACKVTKLSEPREQVSHHLGWDEMEARAFGAKEQERLT